jgi:type II secretory pathway component PulF
MAVSGLQTKDSRRAAGEGQPEDLDVRAGRRYMLKQESADVRDDEKPKSLVQKITSFRVNFGPSRRDILYFTNQLAVMVRAGISINDALASIGEQAENPKFQRIIARINEDVKSGQSLSQAIARYLELFGNLYVHMIAAAEVSGSLSSMLEKLADYLDQEAETRSQVRGAMVYPIIIATMAVSVTIFLLTFVLPRFVSVFAGRENLLPKPTKIIMAISGFLRGYWFVIVPVLGGAAWVFSYFIRTPAGKVWWDKVKLTVPLMRKLCRSLYITRSLHTMGALVNAGVPILNTLSITSEISGNIHYKRMWQRVHESVRQGQKVAAGLSGSPLLPVSVVQMIRSGEESGRLSEVLADVSEFYARELKTVIKTVTSMIEPLMIVLMGFVVGFIAMSIILPIFKMSSLVSGR